MPNLIEPVSRSTSRQVLSAKSTQVALTLDKLPLCEGAAWPVGSTQGSCRLCS